MEGYHKCGHGKTCIPIDKVCDGKLGDCSDDSDEMDCLNWNCSDNRLVIEGGVHICKLAYGDLTWENSSDQESYAPWFTMIMGHYTPCSI